MAELAAEDLAEEFEGFVVDSAVVGQNMTRRGYRVKRTRHVADAASGLAHQENASRHVPGVQAKFPERIQTATGHVGQIDSCRSGTTYAMGRHCHLMIKVDVDVVMSLAAGKAGGSEAVSKPSRFRDVDATI